MTELNKDQENKKRELRPASWLHDLAVKAEEAVEEEVLEDIEEDLEEEEEEEEEMEEQLESLIEEELEEIEEEVEPEEEEEEEELEPEYAIVEKDNSIEVSLEIPPSGTVIQSKDKIIDVKVLSTFVEQLQKLIDLDPKEVKLVNQKGAEFYVFDLAKDKKEKLEA